jgi:hypothetical protein
MTNVATVAMNENWPTMTRVVPGRSHSASQPNQSSRRLATPLLKTRMAMPRITPGTTNGHSINM